MNCVNVPGASLLLGSLACFEFTAPANIASFISRVCLLGVPALRPENWHLHTLPSKLFVFQNCNI